VTNAWTAELEPKLEDERPRSQLAPRQQPRKVSGQREENYIKTAVFKETERVRTVGEGGRNDALNVAALALGQLVAGGVLDETIAVRELTDAALAAGLNKVETKKTIASGMKKGAESPRGIPPANAAQNTVSENGRSLVDGPTAGDPLRGLEHLGKVALIGRDGILELASTAVEYIWQDIALAGTVVLIVGPPAEGKTTLLFLILVARMNLGEPMVLLEREILPAPAGKYLVLIEGEHSESSTARKLVKSHQILGVDDAGLNRVIIVARKAVLLGSPEWLDVQTMVSAGLVSDIAIDTLARVAPADANDEREQVAVFNCIAKAIECAPEGAEKPVVWAVAHTRKNNTTGELGDVSGSVQRVGQADTVLLIKGEKVDGETVSTKTTFAKLREDPETYPKPVSFSIVKGLEGSLSMKTGLEPAADNRPLEDRILELLEVEPRTKTKLRALLGRNADDVEVAITNLFDARRIITKPVKIGGREFKAFALRVTHCVAPDEAPDVPSHRTSTGRAPDES
jgi:hypothetical protein